MIAELEEGRFLRRYRTDDGVESEDGAFVLCGFWLAEALALAGRLDEVLGDSAPPRLPFDSPHSS